MEQIFDRHRQLEVVSQDLQTESDPFQYLQFVMFFVILFYSCILSIFMFLRRRYVRQTLTTNINRGSLLKIM